MNRYTDYSKLDERQLLSALVENFKLSAECCEKMAKGQRGDLYLRLMAQLKVVENCCRYVANGPFGREDARWLQIGLSVEKAHQLCGEWLRRKDPSWRFKGLAEILRRGERSAFNLAHKKTGRRGPILPKEQAGPHRENKPVQIILPPGYERRPN